MQQQQRRRSSAPLRHPNSPTPAPPSVYPFCNLRVFTYLCTGPWRLGYASFPGAHAPPLHNTTPCPDLYRRKPLVSGLQSLLASMYVFAMRHDKAGVPWDKGQVGVVPSCAAYFQTPSNVNA